MTETETREVRVKAKHIRNGRAVKPSCCAFALAVKEAFGTEVVSVGSTVFSVNAGLDYSSWSVDEQTAKFIRLFDRTPRKDRGTTPDLKPFTTTVTRRI
jgi:hypothetical protein